MVLEEFFHAILLHQATNTNAVVAFEQYSVIVEKEQWGD